MHGSIPSGTDVGVLADEPVGHLVGLALDAGDAPRRELVPTQLLQNVVARRAAVDPVIEFSFH